MLICRVGLESYVYRGPSKSHLCGGGRVECQCGARPVGPGPAGEGGWRILTAGLVFSLLDHDTCLLVSALGLGFLIRETRWGFWEMVAAREDVAWGRSRVWGPHPTVLNFLTMY